MNGRTFRCEFCDKTLTSKAAYEHHKRTHEGELLYKCEVCPSAFKEQLMLDAHLAVHTGKLLSCFHCHCLTILILSLVYSRAIVHLPTLRETVHERDGAVRPHPDPHGQPFGVQLLPKDSSLRRPVSDSRGSLPDERRRSERRLRPTRTA